MALIPKYPLDTAAKLALIRAAGWYYDTKLKALDWTPRENARARNTFGDCAHPLNAAFHYFIRNQGKKESIREESTLKYKALFSFGDPRAVYATA